MRQKMSALCLSAKYELNMKEEINWKKIVLCFTAPNKN